MSATTDAVATAAQNGGAAMAITSAVVGIPNAAFGWLNHNSAGVLALCGIGGLMISYLGYRAKKLHFKQMRAEQQQMNEHRT